MQLQGFDFSFATIIWECRRSQELWARLGNLWNLDLGMESFTTPNLELSRARISSLQNTQKSTKMNQKSWTSTHQNTQNLSKIQHFSISKLEVSRVRRMYLVMVKRGTLDLISSDLPGLLVRWRSKLRYCTKIVQESCYELEIRLKKYHSKSKIIRLFPKDDSYIHPSY